MGGARTKATCPSTFVLCSFVGSIDLQLLAISRNQRGRSPKELAGGKKNGSASTWHVVRKALVMLTLRLVQWTFQ